VGDGQTASRHEHTYGDDAHGFRADGNDSPGISRETGNVKKIMEFGGGHFAGACPVQFAGQVSAMWKPPAVGKSWPTTKRMARRSTDRP